MEPRPASSGPFLRHADSFWHAPLVPVALLVTAGVLLDRWLIVPLSFSVAMGVACILAWLCNLENEKLGLLFLGITCIPVGAAYHRYRHDVADNDIRHFADADPKPGRLRGVVHSEPTFVKGSGDDPLRTFPTSQQTRFVLRVGELRTSYDWRPVSGLAQVFLEARVHPVHVGDRVEVVGRLVLPGRPANPGEFDYQAYLDDQGIGAVLTVPPAADGILLLEEGWPRTIHGWLAVLRGWNQEVLARHLPPQTQSLAAALLLGEGSGLTGEEWDKYVRTGVIHVLAISGQHLVTLGFFLWLALKFSGVKRRYAALGIALFLLVYALMTGGRPPVMRAAWGMAAGLGALWLRRQVMPANILALCWLAVIVANPSDIFSVGCQLSFLAVAVLFLGVHNSALSSAFLVPLFVRPEDPALTRLIDESRPLVVSLLMRLGRGILTLYAVNAVVWLALAPLIATNQHLVSPVALLIGPPAIICASLGLIFGFLLLLLAPLGLAGLFAGPLLWALAGSEALVNLGTSLPGAYFYVPDVPAWCLWVFYFGLLLFLTVAWLRPRRLLFAGFTLGWVGAVALWLSGPFAPREFRLTFLAVGHGGCTVLETSDGRVLMYDAGAITGPEVTRRQIAPYLWRRGIGRIDELFLSHADLDHFNGLPALFDRFKVKKISLTPSFAERATPGVRLTLAEIHNRGIPTRVLKAGDRLDEGRLQIEVLHPPAQGPEGNENARSLVMLVRQDNFALLLTGDLESPGLEQVLASAPRKVDVLMAPHHGSRFSNNPDLAKWAQPKLVISSQGAPRGNPKTPNPYEAAGARYLTTWQHGAVMIRQEEGKWQAEGFRSGKKMAIK